MRILPRTHNISTDTKHEMELIFTAHGNPKGQPRARACIRGKHAGVYDPGTADDWKTIVRCAAKARWDGVPFDGPAAASFTFIFARPKNHFRANGKLRDDAPVWHRVKPDRDNLDKGTLDCLTNAGILSDDSIVCSGVIIKRYANDNELPGVQATICSLT